MPAARICNACGRRFKPATTTETRCDACGPGGRPAAAVTEQRKIVEPWRSLYKVPAWHRARARTLERDEHRCRGSFGGTRCGRRAGLQVHHRRPLRVLWAESDSYADFVALACNESLLVTLCPRCHALAEPLARR